MRKNKRESCATCEFFIPNHKRGMPGTCSSHYVRSRQEIDEDNWCRHYKKKEKKEVKFFGKREI